MPDAIGTESNISFERAEDLTHLSKLELMFLLLIVRSSVTCKKNVLQTIKAIRNEFHK